MKRKYQHNPEDFYSLIKAIYNENPIIIQNIINNNLNLLNLQDCYGNTPLLIALEEFKYKSFEAILNFKDNIDFKLKDDGGCSPLHLAILWGNNSINILKKLLDIPQALELINIPDNQNKTPIIWAAENYNHDVMRKLLSCKGIDVSIKDNNYCTPFDILNKKNDYGDPSLIDKHIVDYDIILKLMNCNINQKL
jgi:ankyrin repeat protein